MTVVAGFPAFSPASRVGLKACYHREIGHVLESCVDVRSDA